MSVIGYDENELAFVKPPRMTVIGRRVDEMGKARRKVSHIPAGQPECTAAASRSWR